MRGDEGDHAGSLEAEAAAVAGGQEVLPAGSVVPQARCFHEILLENSAVICSTGKAGVDAGRREKVGAKLLNTHWSVAVHDVACTRGVNENIKVSL